MERHVKSESVSERISRRMLFLLWAVNNLEPKSKSAVAGKAIAGIAIVGRSDIEGE